MMIANVVAVHPMNAALRKNIITEENTEGTGCLKLQRGHLTIMPAQTK
jgi:hypothetical protein